MKAKSKFTTHELKIMEQFPLIGVHQGAVNMLTAITLCRKGIKDSEHIIVELLESSSPVTPSEFEEFQVVLNSMIDHAVFCENSLYEAKVALDEVKWALN
jgi:hypothetical protein